MKLMIVIDNSKFIQKKCPESLSVIYQIRPYLFIALGLGIVFAFLLQLKPTRVGDGSEYYALYLAFIKTLRPWMTDSSFAEYARLVHSGHILGMVPSEHLSQAFPALKLIGTADFNHFWFYSLLAAMIGSTSGLVGAQVEPHTSFLILHWLLLCVPTGLAFRYYGWKGVAVVVLMTFGSPLIWFTDKVHSEFFTYCLALVSVICVLRVNYISAAVGMALASTQNPSFAIVAGFLLCTQVVVGRHRKYELLEVVGIAATVLIVFLHPCYYFFRFGVLTPQLLAGGADLGGNLSSFYIWIFDPDLGLLPNWPMGIAFLVVGGIFLCSSNKNNVKYKSNLSFWLFFLVYFLSAIYAHSSTQNLNSGATPGVARYALWYSPLVFPFALWSFTWVAENRIKIVIASVMCLFLFSLNVYQNYPARSESYSTPTKLSKFIQKKLPGFYNPPAEVFLERYSGLGETPGAATVMAVVGPDCKKVLLIPGIDKNRVTAPSSCRLDVEALAVTLKQKQSNLSAAKYFNLIEDEISSARFVPALNKDYGLKSGGEGGQVLLSGWSARESWGVWSDGNEAKLQFPAPSNISNKNVKILLNLVAFTNGKRLGTKLSINAGSQQLWKGELTGTPTDVVIGIPIIGIVDGSANVSLLIANPASPLSMGLSSDARNLGVGLLSFKYLE